MVALGSVAAGAPSWLAQQFSQADVDRNGVLTAEEAAPYAQELKGADTDQDGRLTFDEVRTHLRKLVSSRLSQIVPSYYVPQLFNGLDKDKDGKLTQAELKAAALPGAREGEASTMWLLVLDEDGDGSLSLQELQSAYQQNGSKPVPDHIAPLDQPPPPYDPPRLPATLRKPRLLKAAEYGVGRRVPDVAVRHGAESKSWAAWAGEKGTVVALVSPSCPVSKRYLPELARQSAAAASQGVSFLFVNLEVGLDPESDAQAAQILQEAGLTGAIVSDDSGRLRATLGSRTTTEVYVIDAARTLVYRGAVDDRYGVGWSREVAQSEYLKDAVAALLSGQHVKIAATEAPGCELESPQVSPVEVPVTYHSRISRLLQQNCVNCHRSGGMAPFPLETLAQVSAKAGMIRRMVEEDLMPPWFAKPVPAGHVTPWGNERSLAAADKADLLTWLANGRPEGDPAEAPLPLSWPDEWELGPPDAIYQIPQPITVKAEGTMPYQNVVIDTGLTEDRWVQAWEVLPTARAVVHHVLIWARDPANLNPAEEQGMGFLAAYVPGSNRLAYPEGLAKKIPRGAQLRFQIHYTPNGVETQDQVRLGLHFADQPPRHTVEVATIAQPRLSIPPGASSHPEMASVPVPVEVRLLRLMPHMHLRGQAFRYEVALPNGDVRTLLEVPRYDFNWQLTYDFAEPLSLPAGSRLRAIGWFDNSAANPHNPDPTRTVRWGEQTYEEMMIGYAEYYVPSQPLPRVAAE